MDVRPLASTPSTLELTALPARNAPSNSGNSAFHEALADASSKTRKIADAAKQFEALVAGQVLKAARESSQGGWLGNDDDQTGELTLEMAEQAFAQALAARGDFGIAKIVTAALERKQS
jgi:Rod binding domain-containing protein